MARLCGADLAHQHRIAIHRIDHRIGQLRCIRLDRRVLLIGAQRPRPLRDDAQAHAIRAYTQQLAEPVINPVDGDIVLMREGGQSMAGHVGTYFFLNYAPCVLHTAAWMQGGSALHRLQDVPGYGLTVEGCYRWN